METKVSPPYRTVITLQDLEFGGTQRYAVHLLNNLNKDLFKLELWVLRGGADMLPMAQSSGVPVTYLSRGRWVTPRSLWRFFRKLKDQKPDVLYTMTAVPNIWGRIFAAVATNSTVISSWRGKQEQQFESFLWRFSDRLICNANALKAHVIKRHGVDPKRVAVAPNGVDINFFSPDRSRLDPHPTVVYIGRLVKEKDPLTLIEAFSLLRELVPDTRLIMIGQGYLRAKVQRKIATSGVKDHIQLISGANDVRPFLRQGWLLVLPSISEGFPQVIIEAMACGLPVVATAVGGAPEIIEHGVNGLLVQPRSPELLAQSMASLLSDLEMRNSMGRMAREIVTQRFSLQNVVKMTEQIILGAIAEKQAAK
ncbi:MAG: glycosyltransferase [Deltaproteobacteria bacterium]|nr:glycosyltransferase [Deltaproteobacteria bacterium]